MEIEIIKQHLKEVTNESLRSFRDDENTFIHFASCTGKSGYVEIGVNGKCQYCVRSKNKTQVFMNALQATDYYSIQILY